MTELRTSFQAPLGEPRIGPDLPSDKVPPTERVFPAEKVPEPAAPTSPCFIHSSWRTSKTWFFELFRHFPQTLCYYEPFNEHLATLTAAEAVQVGPRSWESGHRSSIPYFREYIPLLRRSGGTRLFRPEMSYDWFVPVGGLRGSLRAAELKYLALLTRYAQRRQQIPVFAFSRSLGRIRPIRDQLGGTHIVIIRNLWDQWASYLYQRQVGNPYFVRSILRMIDHVDPFCQYLCDFYLDTKSLNACRAASGAAESWEQQADAFLATLADGDLFSIFVAIHSYFYLNALSAAHLPIDATRLASDDSYKKFVTGRLREMTGLRLTLVDAAESFRFTDADPAVVNRDDIERHIRVALNILGEGRAEHKEIAAWAEQLLEGLCTKGSTSNYLEPARREFIALKTENEGLRAKIGERDAALAIVETRADAVETGLAAAQAELAAQRERLAGFEYERDAGAAASARLEAEAAELRVAIGERDAALAIAETRANAAEAGLTAQRERLAKLEQHGVERIATVDRLQAQTTLFRQAIAQARQKAAERDASLSALEAEAVRLRALLSERDTVIAAAHDQNRAHEAEILQLRQAATSAERVAAKHGASLRAAEDEVVRLRTQLGERDAALAAAEAEAGAAETCVNELRAELATERSRLGELQRERGEHAAALAQLEITAETVRAELGEREVALAAAAARADQAEASRAEAWAELAAQRTRLAELERERNEREGAVDRLHAQTRLLQHAVMRARQQGEERAAGFGDLEKQVVRLRTRLGERDAALAAAEACVSELRAELAAERSRLGELQRERGEHAAALAQLEIEAEAVRAELGEREVALAAAETRADESAASRAEASAELAVQRARLAELERERNDILELRSEMEILRRDLSAERQVARELMTAATADMLAPRSRNRGGRRLLKMAGVSRGMRARAIRAADRARDARLWAEATRHYHKVLARDPHDAATWVQYGHALKETGRLAQAETAYRQSLACDPGVADTHLQLGHVLKLQGRTALAQAAYLRAFALDPAMPYPLEELTALGWSPAHVSELGQLPAIPGISQLHSLRVAADAARDQRDWSNAARLYGELVAADPTAHAIAVQLGHAYKEMGEIEHAAQTYYAVLEKTPADDDLHLQIGHLEKMRGDFTAAAAHYKTAASLNPANADAVREYDALSHRLRALYPKGEREAKPGSDRLGGEPADHAAAEDDLRFLDARAGEIFRQLTAALT